MSHDVFCGLILANRNTQQEASCKFLEYQLEHIAYVYLITSTDGTVQLLTPKEFSVLKTIFDNARTIYCFADSEILYGHLRATPNYNDTLDVVALSTAKNKGILNPFLEGVDTTQAPDFIQLEDAESKIDPTQESKESKQKEISTRWLGVFPSSLESPTSTHPKKQIKEHGEYFSEQDMIHWRFKTQSVSEDIKSSIPSGFVSTSFDTCIEHNRVQPWWKEEEIVTEMTKDQKENNTFEILDEYAIFNLARQGNNTKLQKVLSYELHLLKYIVTQCYTKQQLLRWPKRKYAKGKAPVVEYENVKVKKS